jgi:PIN domain nuclease of toxin-antitoxin system
MLAFGNWRLSSHAERCRHAVGREYGANSSGSFGVTIKSITPEIAALATQFPNDYPRDTIDRLIGANARAEGLALITRDESIRKSPLLKTIW